MSSVDESTSVDLTGGHGGQNYYPPQPQNLRRCEVILLDGRSVTVPIEPCLYAGTLFDRVAEHFNLKEKEYFGLAFLDEA